MSTAPQRPFEPEPTPLLEDPAPAAVQPLSGDDEWVGEKTILIAEQSEPVAWLQRVDTGEWLCLETLPAVLGRHERAAVPLDDPSVSRRHAQLISQGEQGFVIEDLGSSNGIRVAGNRVDRLMLLDGDQFELGHVALRFSSRAPDALGNVAADAAPAAVASTRPGDALYKPNLKRLAPVAVAAVAMVAAVALYTTRTPRTVVVPSPDAPQSMPASPATSAPASGSPEAAVPTPVGLAAPVDTATPGATPSPAADSPTGLAMTGSLGQRQTGTGPAAVADTPAAAAGANSEPTRSAEVAPDLASAKLRKLEAPEPAAPVTGAAAPPDPAELARSLASAPVETRPKPAPRPRSQPVRRSSEFSRAYIDTALQMYIDGDSDNAIRRLGIMSRSLRNQKQFRDEAAVLQQQVQALVKNYEQGQSALDRGDRAEAAASWARFLRDEGELFGTSSSVYAKRISRVVAEQYVRDGDQANAEGRFHDAYRSWTKALQYEPDGPARDSIAQLELKGQELFREGYRLESVSIERAKALWTEVTELLPPGTEYHTKARAKLRWHEQGGR